MREGQMNDPAPTPVTAKRFVPKLRQARFEVQNRAEDFLAVALVVDQLGAALGIDGGMGRARKRILKLLPLDRGAQEAYVRVTKARNAAAHEGAIARATAPSAIALSIALEDALMKTLHPSELDTVAAWMNPDPVIVRPYETVSDARTKMLAHGYDALPVAHVDAWRLITAATIAEHLDKGGSKTQTLEDSGCKLFRSPRLLCPDMQMSQALYPDSIHVTPWPALVVRPDGTVPTALVGILTPHDFLVRER